MRKHLTGIEPLFTFKYFEGVREFASSFCLCTCCLHLMPKSYNVNSVAYSVDDESHVVRLDNLDYTDTLSVAEPFFRSSTERHRTKYLERPM